MGLFSGSAEGTLVYLSGALGNVKKQLTWFDRSGKSLGAVGMSADLQWAALSPDGATIATERRDQDGGSHDIWLRDLTKRRGVAVDVCTGRQPVSRVVPRRQPRCLVRMAGS